MATARGVPECLRCHRPMSTGFMATANPLSWVDRVGVLDAGLGTERLVHQRDVLLGAAHLPSWRCVACRVMWVDYGAIRD